MSFGCRSLLVRARRCSTRTNGASGAEDFGTLGRFECISALGELRVQGFTGHEGPRHRTLIMISSKLRGPRYGRTAITSPLQCYVGLPQETTRTESRNMDLPVVLELPRCTLPRLRSEARRAASVAALRAMRAKLLAPPRRLPGIAAIIIMPHYFRDERIAHAKPG